ncbi:MAG: hypothetical protein ACI9U2_001094 [Bradymonadia bacterium]
MRSFTPIVIALLLALSGCGATTSVRLADAVQPVDAVQPMDALVADGSAGSNRATATRLSDKDAAEAVSSQKESSQRANKASKRRRKIKPFYIRMRRGKERINVRIIRVDPDNPERMWIDKDARRAVKTLLSDKRHKRNKRIPERLLWYLYLAGQHFDAPIEVVSGYRSRERMTSRHRHMKAVDFRIRGASPKAIWIWAKRFDNVGLGWYPTSKFVHMDVREKSAYWIDDSGPGQRSRYRKKVSQKRAKSRRRLR